MKKAALIVIFCVVAILVLLTGCKQNAASESEKQVISESPLPSALNLKVITINGGNFPPFIMDESQSGLFVDITNAAFQGSGYTIDYTNDPFARGMENLKNGVIDGALYVTLTEERKTFLAFTDPLYSVKVCIFGLKSGKLTEYKSMDDLKGSIVGTLRGSVREKELQAKEIQTESVDDMLQGLKMLLLGRVDYYIGTKEIMEYKAMSNFSKEEYDKLSILMPPVTIEDSYLAFSQKNPLSAQYVSIFNEGLERIKKDGTYQAILKKYGLDMN